MDKYRNFCSRLLLFLVLIGAVKGDIDNVEENDYFKEHGINPSNTDIVFLLDRSGSVGEANFETEVGFVGSFLTNFVVAPNATRVAVISFSNDAMVHVDYLKEKGNKCLLARDLQNINYTDSRATNTGAGLLKALEVFRSARAKSEKILVLVTDGLHTLGPNPVDAAKQLKNSGVQVHVFGIGRYLKSELGAIASSPKHVLECESFTKFRNMYGNGMKDQWNRDDTPEACYSKCHSQHNDPGCCDTNAICGCSLTRGVNDCLCKPGHYGSGLKGKCEPCPGDTYQDEYGKLTCKHCPMDSTTEDVGSKSIEKCVCQNGYKRSTGEGGALCTVVTCPPLQAPVNGQIEGGECSREYESRCYFQCNEGYMLEDEDSGDRVCGGDGTWSSKTPVCIPLRCDRKPVLANGSLECPDVVTINTTCTYKCHRGHKLNGPSTTTCVERDQWSGEVPKCELVGCVAPPVVQYSRQQRSTSKKVYNFADTYIIECFTGFKLEGSPFYRCDESGRWNLPQPQPPRCIDVTPPTIVCPQVPKLNATLHRKTALLSWKGPQVKDNSQRKIILKQDPAGLISPATLEIGTYYIVYYAVDHANLTSNCTLRIDVVDNQNPQVMYCPPDIRVNTTDPEVAVQWKEPEFSDNSDGKVNVTQNHRSGDTFNLGSHQITYRAADPSNNVAYCKFSVHVSRSQCPYSLPPRNGALTCEDLRHGDLCQVFCNDEYDFVSEPAEWYICDNSLTWSTDPEGMDVPWPDCSAVSQPNLKKRFGAHYYTGDCRDSNVQAAIRVIFQNNFQSFKSKEHMCDQGVDCQLTRIHVYCGDTNDLSGNGRSRRSVPSSEERYTIAEVDAELHFTLLMNGTTDMEEFSESIDATFSGLGEVPESILDDVIAESHVSLEMKLLDSSIRDTFLVCGEGKVLNGQQCVLCPVGTYHDKTQDLCVPCAKGKYQDEEGSNSCKPCPANTMTETLKSTNADDCRAVCTEGTYSFTGLETCVSCPRGTYQDQTHQTFCKTCPMGTTTEMIGSTGIQDCKLLCSPGTMSETGLEPCSPCHTGFYQAYRGQRSCDECIFPFTTLEKGSVSSFECVEYDHCLSEPCKNNGTCEGSLHDFSCSCPPEFYGEVCELEKPSCHKDLCLNGGSCRIKGERVECFCTPDYEGERCQNPKDLCLDTACLNGGECVIEDGQASCQCVPGYVGDECQHRVDITQRGVVPQDDEDERDVPGVATDEFLANRWELL